jgi:transcriptional regulator with XRE-family HTH domain
MPKPMSYETQQRILQDPKHEMFPNVRVMRRLHDRQMTAKDLADFMKVTRSAVSKMLNRPGGVRLYAPKIATFFNTSEAELFGAPPPASQPLPLGAPVTGTTPTVLQEELGQTLEANEIPLPPGWALVRVVNRARGVDWYLCAAVGSQPREGDDVIATTTDGQMRFRTYNVEENKPELIVLTSRDPAERPIVVKASEIVTLRRVVIPLPNLRS